MIKTQEEAVAHVKPHYKLLKASSVVIVCEDGGIYHGENQDELTKGKGKFFVVKSKIASAIEVKEIEPETDQD